MKRKGHLIEQIADVDNLYLAFHKACRGKQRKAEVLAFREHFDENIAMLRENVLSGHITVGNYHYFTIYDPKERVICAAPFRERVLHHAIMNVCHDFFDRSLISDTYATRPGKGVYAALDKVVYAASHYEYMVKLDFRKYFDSISHDVLKQMLERKFKDNKLLGMFNSIIDSYQTSEGRGLPIGNLTSQYFANMYLSAFDHLAKEKLRIPVYIRYMDDILMAGDDIGVLKGNVALLDAHSQTSLRLMLKTPIYKRSKDGMVFLGYRVRPYYYTLSGRSKRRFRSRLIEYERLRSDGRWSEGNYTNHILPLLSFVSHAKSWKFRKACIDIYK